MISKGLLNLGFEKTETDQCVFKKENVIILFNIDDYIILLRKKEDLDKNLQDIKRGISITDERNIETYLGIQIDHELGFMRMSQPNLINHIIEAIPGMDKANLKSIPMSPNTVLTKNKPEKERQET